MLTFVIPVAPYHEALAERAVASCRAQTLVCQVMVIRDHDRHGAGWARNRGLEQVETPFVSFLDADDWLEPTFAEATLRAYDGRHYVFTDWWKDNIERVEAPPCPWRGDGGYHVVTTLLPTSAVRYVGGFDESLPALEDTDFYWKLTRSGFGFRHLPGALFHYSKDGQRSRAFLDNPDFQRVGRMITDRYRDKPMTDCEGCGGSANAPSLPLNEFQPGDVLAQTLWQGNRSERGRATGRLYRGGWGAQVWMNPADIDAAPHLFARVVEMPPALDDAAIEQFRQVAEQVLGAPSRTHTYLAGVADGLNIPVTVTDTQPGLDVGRVLRLYAPVAP